MDEARKESLKNKSKEASLDDLMKMPHIEELGIIRELRDSLYGGSNNWVISGKHTKNGKPLLANDPHLGAQIPSQWYIIEVEYKLENGELFSHFGATVGGIPAIMLGRTSKGLSTGITALHPDVIDLYEEKVSEDNNEYNYDGKWLKLTKRQEVINIKGGEQVTHEVRLTHRGPLMLGFGDAAIHIFKGSAIGGLDRAYSFQWASYVEKSTAFPKIKKAFLSSTVKEFMDSFDGYIGGPNLSLVITDAEGSIGYFPLTSYPKRKNPYSGAHIKKGWVTDDDWIGFVD
jgi:penicillin amidase